MSITKGIIHYSNGIAKEIQDLCWHTVFLAEYRVVASFNERANSYPDMLRQIISCLEDLDTDVVFFCEHDVIYNPTHFEFTPERDDIFYYNENVWRWDYPKKHYITYDRLLSLSGMCCYTKLALAHFKKRLRFIEINEFDKDTEGEPSWMRKMGFEPGTKKRKRGGFSDDDFETWRSAKPLIDIRHSKTFSPRKVRLADFKHKPTGWKEVYERP